MKKIRTALLSYGMSGKVFHAPFLTTHEGYELVGAWERSTKKIQQDYPEAKSYNLIEELLADNIDLVVVNTPVATHYEYAKQALLAGKHALVEKAFTTTVAEAEELKAIADAKGLKLCVFQNRRWDSDFLTVKAIVDQNLLGDIVEAEFRFDRYNPGLSPKAHKEENNSGAGVLKDLGSHIIDQAVYLFGFPKSVFADVRITRENSKVDDLFEVLLYYPDKRVRLRAGFFFREPVPAYAIHGTKGSLIKERGDVQEADLKAGRLPNADGWGTEPEDFMGLLHIEKDGQVIRGLVDTIPGNYKLLFDKLYEAVTENIEVPVTGTDGIQVMKIIEAALESSETRKVVELT